MTTPDISPTTPPDNPLAVASMICGALSLSGSGFLLGIPAIVLGVIALKHQPAKRDLSIVGIVTGALGTFISLVVILFVFWVVFSVEDDVPSSPPQIPPAEQQYEPSQI